MRHDKQQLEQGRPQACATFGSLLAIVAAGERATHCARCKLPLELGKRLINVTTRQAVCTACVPKK